MENEFKYPRRLAIRAFLRRIMMPLAFALLSDFKVVGEENFPDEGPLLVVANHFSFIDPAAIARIAPWPIEFVGGFNFPNAPQIVHWLPKLWGYYPVFRGTGSRYALRASVSVLSQNGVVCIFPEGGSWATVLRPARPGAAFIATRANARLLPVGLDGLPNVFPRLRKGKRAQVTVRIGKPFGPFDTDGRGRIRRRRLDEIGHEIMRRISELIPPDRRGFYSDDPDIREAAKGTEIYPWDEAIEI
ncbi:MAG: 1-acyl-sn-glycerol-3-phosphate acyltransferase [Anaerolineae bacterium]|nr:1-acyl-sn-glycerol-3-phosphate acyltransferase [Anaerolineae bacterium]